MKKSTRLPNWQENAKLWADRPMTVEEIAKHPVAAGIAKALIERFTVEEGDCLVWTGRTGHGSPIARLCGQVRTIRPVVLALAGTLIPAGMVAVDTCRHPGCVRLDHLRVATKKQLGRRTSKEGSLRRPPRIAALIRAGQTRKNLKLNHEIADQIRRSSLSAEEEAAIRGVAPSTIRDVRAWRTWSKGGVPNNSVFSWRP